jgi:hypothetical protein
LHASIAELLRTARESPYHNQVPTAFDLQKWNGSGWDTIHSESGLSWSSGETKTFVFGSAPSRSADFFQFR